MTAFPTASHSHRKPPADPRNAAPQQDLTITRVGSTGDGIAALRDGSIVYLPFTLPGETVEPGPLTRRGDGWTATSTIRSPSLDRQPAPCPHFGACGGCTLQHWQDGPYAAWKTAELQAALSRAGYADAPLAPLIRTPPASRRRVDLAVRREGRDIRVGLHRHRSREVIDLHTCLVLEPELVTLIQALRRYLPGISAFRLAGSAIANRLDTGIDLLLRTDAPLTAADGIALAKLAREAGLCRVSWALQDGPPEVAAQLEPAIITLGGAAISPPAGAFLQASGSAEAAITAAVLAGLPERMPGRAHILELFAGCGTLTMALATRARVSAYEGDAGAHAALRRAVAGRRIQAHRRDLTRQPLSAKELAVDAIVLDPPYAGAAAQMASIAISGTRTIIYVSCNPAALARDARPLQMAGYTLRAATPVDQFLWSAAVESVCVFARD